MRLFELGEDKQVMLNKVWIAMIPEFVAVLKADKGSKGDYRGSLKLLAQKQFTFIYFYTDFSSPIKDWQDEERRKEAIYYAGLEEKELTPLVWAAQEKYQELQVKGSRPLRTLKNLYKGLDALDTYFGAIDFTLKDSLKRLVNDPSDLITNATKMKKMYAEIREFEKMVEEDLKQTNTGIRGPNSTLGDQEGKVKEWSEIDIMKGSDHVAGDRVITSKSNFADIIQITREQAVKERQSHLAEVAELEGQVDKIVREDDEEDEE